MPRGLFVNRAFEAIKSGIEFVHILTKLVNSDFDLLNPLIGIVRRNLSIVQSIKGECQASWANRIRGQE